MEKSGKKNQEKKTIPEVTTFPVPFASKKVKENVTFSNKSAKDSQEKIISQAFKFHLQGNFSEAAKFYQNFIKLGFNDPRVFSNYAIILNDIGKKKEAAILLRKAIKLKPDFASAYCNLGTILNDLGKSLEAEMFLGKAIQLEPDCADYHSNFGTILKNIGKLKEAEYHTRKAIEIKPDFAKAHSNLGWILKETGERKEARFHLLKAIELNPKLELANFMLAQQLYYEGNYEEAINYLKDKNHKRSQSLYLGCLLCLDRVSDFSKLYSDILEKRICNAEIGGIIDHANIIYKKKYKSTFCNEAKNYIFWDKINEELFSRSDLNELISYVKDKKTIKRCQRLLNEGMQTSGNLFSLDYPFIKSIKHALELKIELYKAKFKDSKEGFINNWPKDYELRSWIISMKSGGFLKQHNHEYGWVTGSFYLQLPRSDIASNSGNISFSYQGPQYPIKGKSFNSRIKKLEERDICIFPSSLFHKTIPFESSKERICFVFDLIQK